MNLEHIKENKGFHQVGAITSCYAYMVRPPEKLEPIEDMSQQMVAPRCATWLLGGDDGSEHQVRKFI